MAAKSAHIRPFFCNVILAIYCQLLDFHLRVDGSVAAAHMKLLDCGLRCSFSLEVLFVV